MNLALAAVRDLLTLADQLARPVGLPEKSACARQADAAGSLDGVAVLPPPWDPDLLRRMLYEASTGPGVQSLPANVVRHAPSVLWAGNPAAAGFPGLLATVMQGAGRRPQWLRSLIEAWLRDFDPVAPGLAAAGLEIAALVADTRHPQLKPWADAHRRYKLFDAAAGPAQLAHDLLHGSDDVMQIRSATGMQDPLRADGKFFRAVIGEMLRALPAALGGRTAAMVWPRAALLLEAERTTQAVSGRLSQTTGLRFDSVAMAGRTARACLQIWLDGRASSALPRNEIQSFLVRLIHDPRLFPARWEQAGEAATGLMRSWLAAASLDAFFALISDMTDDKRWTYRQAFWRACLRKMPTAEVWVVLGPSLAGRAKTIRDLAHSFGYLDGSGVNSNQAVLLIRLGSLVLSEWSDMGPVRAYRVNDPNCPRLYRTEQRRYRPAELKAQSLPFPDHPVLRKGGQSGSSGLVHHNAEGGLWQGCAAALLEREVGVRLTRQDYIPR